MLVKNLSLFLVLSLAGEKASCWAFRPSSTVTHRPPAAATTTGSSSPSYRYLSKGSSRPLPLFATVPKVEEEKDSAKLFDDAESSSILGEPVPYSKLTIGVLKETYPGENRVSQTPDSVANLVKAGTLLDRIAFRIFPRDDAPAT